MASYAYFPGDGVTRLDSSTPVGQSEPGPVLDEAIRQIKSYLADSTQGPDAKISALLAAVNAVSITSNNVPTGVILSWGKAGAPAGYLEAAGQAVSRSTYSALFALYGATFGSGDGSTTFNVPDLRGVAMAGVDAAVPAFTPLGTTSGAHTHQLSIGEIPAHTHTYNATYLLSNSDTSITAYPFQWSSSGAKTTGGTTSKPPSGGDVPHNNVQPAITVNYIIKT
jgi:microcystin-dependent protein